MFCRMTKQQRDILEELIGASIEQSLDCSGYNYKRLGEAKAQFTAAFKCQSPIDDAAEEHY